MTDPMPSEIQLKTYSRKLVLSYGDQSHELDFEFLRVLSPSAEVQGHGQPILQIGKENVMITNLEPVGNYAIKITFNDGHDSGIYSWALLKKFCDEKDQLWEEYLQKLKQAGVERSI